MQGQGVVCAWRGVSCPPSSGSGDGGGTRKPLVPCVCPMAGGTLTVDTVGIPEPQGAQGCASTGNSRILGILRHASRAQGRTPQYLVVPQPSSWGRISQAAAELRRGAVTPKLHQQSATCGVWLGDREVSITWAPCVNSGQMEKLAVWLINVVYIKQLRVGGFARWWGS